MISWALSYPLLLPVPAGILRKINDFATYFTAEVLPH
jgi:hypothetical protein